MIFFQPDFNKNGWTGDMCVGLTLVRRNRIEAGCNDKDGCV